MRGRSSSDENELGSPDTGVGGMTRAAGVGEAMALQAEGAEGV
jgi:hypothetical protein